MRVKGVAGWTAATVTSAAALLGVALVSIDASRGDDRQRVITGATARPFDRPLVASDGSMAVDYRVYFDTPEEFVREADEVLIGEIISESRAPVRQPGSESRYQNRVLRVKSERAYKGDVPTFVDIETPGWVTNPGQPEKQIADAGGLRLEVGDRVAVAIAVGKSNRARRGLVSGQGALVLVDGEVADTGRLDPTVRKLEALTENELRNLFERSR